MKANDFVKNYGIKYAVMLIEAIGFPASELEDKYSPEDLKIMRKGVVQGDLIRIEDLKRLVASHELVNLLGGLKEAVAKFIKYQHQEPCFQEYFKCSLRRLEQAIADVETC